MTVDYLKRGRRNRSADPALYDIYCRQFRDAEPDKFSVVFNSELPVSAQGLFCAFGGYNFRDTDAWTHEAGSD